MKRKRWMREWLSVFLAAMLLLSGIPAAAWASAADEMPGLVEMADHPQPATLEAGGDEVPMEILSGDGDNAYGYENQGTFDDGANEFEIEIAYGYCGDNLSWSLEEKGTLTISGTGKMWDYFYCHPAPEVESNIDPTRNNGTSEEADGKLSGFSYDLQTIGDFSEDTDDDDYSGVLEDHFAQSEKMPEHGVDETWYT